MELVYYGLKLLSQTKSFLKLSSQVFCHLDEKLMNTPSDQERSQVVIRTQVNPNEFTAPIIMSKQKTKSD
jgi:hypothetical protein